MVSGVTVFLPFTSLFAPSIIQIMPWIHYEMYFVTFPGRPSGCGRACRKVCWFLIRLPRNVTLNTEENARHTMFGLLVRFLLSVKWRLHLWWNFILKWRILLCFCRQGGTYRDHFANYCILIYEKGWCTYWIGIWTCFLKSLKAAKIRVMIIFPFKGEF